METLEKAEAVAGKEPPELIRRADSEEVTVRWELIVKDNGEASVLGVPSLGIQSSLLLISLETKLLNFSRAQFPLHIMKKLRAH